MRKEKLSSLDSSAGHFQALELGLVANGDADLAVGSRDLSLPMFPLFFKCRRLWRVNDAFNTYAIETEIDEQSQGILATLHIVASLNPF